MSLNEMHSVCLRCTAGLPLTLAILLGLGCGGSAHTPANPNPPKVYTMTLDVTSATQGDGGGSVPVTFTLDWEDPDGDVVAMWVDKKTRMDRVELPNLAGKTHGTLQDVVWMPTTNAGDYFVSVHLVDGYGHPSNARTIPFVIKPAP